MFLRLKDEIFFMLHNSGIEVFCGNIQLNKLITTDDNNVFFDFLNFLTTPRSIDEINKYDISFQIKDDIIKFLTNNNYALWETSKNVIYSRTELFINTFPISDYSEFINEVNNINILLIGLGTAGSYVLELLTKLGFKSFFIVDGDKVKKENLDSQFYYEDNLNKYKVDVIKNKYTDINILSYTKYLRSANELNTLLSKFKFTYIINCADDYKLTENLLHLLINGTYKFHLIESGYAPLLQQVHLIKSKEKAKIFYDKIKLLRLKYENNKMLAKNNGSIFNAWLSAYSIAKIIFDNIIGYDYSEIGEFDFLQNRYYLGNQYNKIYYDYFSKLIQENMKYKSSTKFINPSTNFFTLDNIFKKTKFYNIMELQENSTLREYLNTNYNLEDLIVIEEYAEKLSLIELKINKDIEQIVVDNFISYVSKHYNTNIKKLRYLINNNIYEHYHKNSLKQNVIKKIGDDYIIFIQKHTNLFEKILCKIHELFHYIYFTISDNEYEHENFVMSNEIKFYYQLLSKSNLSDIVIYYFKNLLRNHIYNSIALDYEKSLHNEDFTSFKINNNNLIENDISSLVEILNKKINSEKPFNTLKYFKAFDNNKLLILFILKELNI